MRKEIIVYEQTGEQRMVSYVINNEKFEAEGVLEGKIVDRAAITLDAITRIASEKFQGNLYRLVVRLHASEHSVELENGLIYELTQDGRRERELGSWVNSNMLVQETQPAELDIQHLQREESRRVGYQGISSYFLGNIRSIEFTVRPY